MLHSSGLRRRYVNRRAMAITKSLFGMQISKPIVTLLRYWANWQLAWVTLLRVRAITDKSPSHIAQEAGSGTIPLFSSVCVLHRPPSASEPGLSGEVD